MKDIFDRKNKPAAQEDIVTKLEKQAEAARASGGGILSDFGYGSSGPKSNPSGNHRINSMINIDERNIAISRVFRDLTRWERFSNWLARQLRRPEPYVSLVEVKPYRHQPIKAVGESEVRIAVAYPRILTRWQRIKAFFGIKP